MKVLVFLITSIFLTACASKKGFNRGALQDQLKVKDVVVTDAEIAKILKTKPNLKKPFKLAVYLKEPNNFHRYGYSWRWSSEDKASLMDLAKDESLKDIVSNIYYINPSTVSGTDIKSIRLAAARHGADAVLVINGAGDMDKYNNKLGITYILLVTGFFVPGSVADSLFILNASMWDVRNEYLYFTAQAEAMETENYIPFFKDEDKVLIDKTKKVAIGKLKKEVIDMVKGK